MIGEYDDPGPCLHLENGPGSVPSLPSSRISECAALPNRYPAVLFRINLTFCEMLLLSSLDGQCRIFETTNEFTLWASRGIPSWNIDVS